MKKIIFAFIFSFISFISFSQDISELGNATINDIKNNNSSQPCQETPNKALRYCSEDGNMIVYTFDNNLLTGITFCSVFLTKSLAENEFIHTVEKFKKTSGITPNVSDGKATFIITKNIAVIYEVKEFKGSFYLFFENILY